MIEMKGTLQIKVYFFFFTMVGSEFKSSNNTQVLGHNVREFSKNSQVHKVGNLCIFLCVLLICSTWTFNGLTINLLPRYLLNA